ncbi:MarR family winged helix-turn-helix transcriptional regulator [Hirschia litorea]|uniref:MarR family winged helix-turn-helix transcriptional regulator n=1 Tax=Hirschia litorea TaxID=1199156 RepID=A0ABW2IKH7_9PROT
MFFLKELPSRATLETYAKTYKQMNVEAVQAGLVLMRRASLLEREIEAYFADYELSQLRFHILIVIDREVARDSLTMTEILARIDVSKPVMTRTLSGLETQGLITIMGDEKDKRLKHVCLTKMGKDKLHAVLPGYHALINHMMQEGENVL